MTYTFRFALEKNQFLKEARGVSFEDIVNASLKNRMVANKPHFNKKRYPNQNIMLMEIDGYIYLVPFVADKKKEELFLKTVYPSRKFTKLYLQRNEKNKNKPRQKDN